MLRLLIRQGVTRGLLRGNRTWLVIGVGAGALRLVRRLTRDRPETLARERLESGDTLVIRALER